jgi:leader peptidase (prepilin peptidase)/N-methyltransferase
LPGPWACWQCPRSPAASLATSAAAIGTAALACRYLVLPVNMPGDLGLGDAKLAASTGAALGWIGWPALLSGIVAGFALGGVYGGMPLIVDHATQLPLGPFLLLGTLAAIAV